MHVLHLKPKLQIWESPSKTTIVTIVDLLIMPLESTAKHRINLDYCALNTHNQNMVLLKGTFVHYLMELELLCGMPY